MALLNWPGSETENANENHRGEPGGATDRAPLVLPDTTIVEINRALASRIEADFDLLVSGADWSPLLAHGEPTGFTLHNVSPDSLLDAFGLRDSDTLLWAPGDSYDFGADEVVFRVRRAGRERRIVIRVGDG